MENFLSETPRKEATPIEIAILLMPGEGEEDAFESN